MKEIIFVTGNKGKLASAQKHFDDDVKLFNIDFDIVEPEVNDIEYIAEYKVREAYKKTQKPCIALDAGFYIPNYPGNPNFPGAFPKREILEKFGVEGLLEKMKGVEDRECYFRECLAYFDGKELKKFFGTTYGQVTTEKRGIATSQKWSDLWYVFIPRNCTKTMAEMNDEERANRNDGYVSPFIEFRKWFEEQK